jgi:hypothetical protein
MHNFLVGGEFGLNGFCSDRQVADLPSVPHCCRHEVGDLREGAFREEMLFVVAPDGGFCLPVLIVSC